jgi:endonuclease YncB( thermonuclease family)
MIRMPAGRRNRNGLRAGDLLLAVAILAAGLLVALRIGDVAALQIEGDAFVHDGDTLTAAGQRVRLLGLDAPEIGQRCAREGGDYACGAAARDALRQMVAGRRVECVGWRRDRYNRLLATCRVDGRDLNAALVRQGWAIAYGDFDAEERDARRERRGVWAGDFDRPADWRSTHGGATETGGDLIARLWRWMVSHLGLAPGA